ncbi:MAG: S-adenosyl-l-methionine hydroxide adenosyltransferase family protein [Actinomycetota bacterium]
MSRPLGFLTDYGPQTEHVGALHAVAATIAPGSDRIDLAHDVSPGDVRWGAILVDRLVRLMPRESVTTCVVDPGVGTTRRAVALELEWGKVVVGPDNGLLGLAAERLGPVRAVEITSPDHMRQPVSATFHGRDIFAPAAAHLAEGVPLDALGPEIDPAVILRPHLPEAEAMPGTLEALVAGVDRFGNLALWATAEHLMAAGLVEGNRLWVASAEGGRSQATLGRTFADVPRGALLAYIDSGGLLSVALNGGSAEDRLRATAGEIVALMRQE